MYNLNQSGQMGPYPGMGMGPQMSPPMPQANMMADQQLQPFPQPNLSHPMNQPYPYPIPVQAPLPMQPMQPMQMQQPQMQPPQMQQFQRPLQMQQPQQMQQPEMQHMPQPQQPPYYEPPRYEPPRHEPPQYEPPQRPQRPPMTRRPRKGRDFGPQPYVVDIEEATIQNDNFRTALWTGKHLQVTLMSIDANDDIGVEIHRDNDQFLRIEAGQGVVLIGDKRNELTMQSRIKSDDAIMIPAGKWHNIINTGPRPLKLYSIYAPIRHPHGTVQETKEEAMEENR